MKTMNDEQFGQIKDTLQSVWHLIQLGKPEDLPKYQKEIMDAVDLMGFLESPFDKAETTESNSASFARRELERLEKACKNERELKQQRMVTSDVLDLIGKFSTQGHSGFSASYVLNLFNRLADFLPILPLTGEDDEWGEPYDFHDGKKVQQNIRCSSVFRYDFDNSTSHNIDDIVFSDNGGATWFTSNFKAEQYRKPITFPYMPPSEPRRIYIKYTKEVPVGETCDEFEDITGNEEEIKKLREKWNEMRKRAREAEEQWEKEHPEEC